MPSRRVRITILGISLLLLLGAGAALAGSVEHDKLRSGERVVISENEVLGHDLYAFAGTVVVDGTIEGDLVAGAGVVTVNGTVEGDLTVGAGQVFVLGEVQGDVRAGAGDVTVDGTIGEDLLVGSGRLHVRDGGTIGEDLFFAAGAVVLDGDVEGDIAGTAGEYVRNGSVGGTEDVVIDPGAEPPPDPGDPADLPRLVGDGVRQWVSVVILGALGLLLVPNALRTTEGALRRRPLASAGMGIGVIVGYLIGVIALLLLAILAAIALASVTLDGMAAIVVWGGILTLLVSTFLLIVATLYLVDVVVGLAVGQLAARGWATSRWHELALLAGGSFVIVLVMNLPVIGPMAKLVVIVLGLGAMAVAVGEWWTRGHPPAVVAFPAAPPAPASPSPAPSAAPAMAPPAEALPAADAPAEAPAGPAEPAPPTPKTTRSRKPKAPPVEPAG
jgi:cytoskeletal protein CcmA (bactofilin family)